RLLDALVGREAPLADEALAAAPNDEALRRFAAVEDLRALLVLAERTAHGLTLSALSDGHAADEDALDREVLGQDDGVAARAGFEAPEVAPPQVIRGVAGEELARAGDGQARGDGVAERPVERQHAPGERPVGERRAAAGDGDALAAELGRPV